MPGAFIATWKDRSDIGMDIPSNICRQVTGKGALQRYHNIHVTCLFSTQLLSPIVVLVTID